MVRLLRCFAALCACAALALSSCVGVRTLADPMLEIRTRGGSELGVSTDYGVVFLGRTARSGPVEITAWFGDGPNIEKSVIEPVGNGIYTAETEIRLPQALLTFENPKPGTKLLVIGRTAKGLWKNWVVVESDPRVLGIVTSIPLELQDAPDQVGAGVFIVPEEDETQKRLVGLVSGRIALRTAQGEREFLTVVGPTDLWRLVSHRREQPTRRRWVYREDIM
jgi:hypothetical protein